MKLFRTIKVIKLINMTNYIVLVAIVLNIYNCNNRSDNNTDKDGDCIPIKFKYENGATEQEFTMCNGLTEGEVKWYYPSGSLKSKAFFYNDIQVGEAYSYRDNGSLEIISFADSNGDVRYVAYYDSLDNLVRDEGFPIFYAPFSKEDSVDRGELIRFEVTSPKLVNYTMFLDVYKVGDKEELYINNFRITNKRPLVEISFQTPGNKEIIFISKLVQDNTDELFRIDSFQYKLYVR